MTEGQISKWRLKDFAVGDGAATRAFEADTDGGEWIDATAPGDTHLALRAAGRIGDPFAQGGEEACAWIGEREWWWRADFEAAPPGRDERLILTFEGLDTFAEIWLNGEAIGRSDNMFVTASFDIGAHVQSGVNRLAVAFTPPAIVTADKAPLSWGRPPDPLSETKRNLVRKAQFGWGWDWGPRLPTVGIWAPVTIRRQRAAAIVGVRFTTLEASREQARVSVDIAVDAFAAAQLSAHIVLTDPDGATVFDRRIEIPGEVARAEFEIAEPRLWWTSDLGSPELYTLTVLLTVAGKALDERSLRVGVLTIALDTSLDPDEPGTSFFRFVLNGVPIFAKGACWIPASSFPGAVDADRYRLFLEMSADAHMNMIRVWGGGVYEHDAFYDLCDELGLLVWQDFMFACAPYPDDAAFAASVEAEVRCQVTRLRNHASLALWCGNNECQAIQSFANHLSHRDDPLPGVRLYDEVMPAVVAELDPSTPYWPGSPAGGPNPNSMLAGDVHNWTVWHGIPPIPVDRPVGAVDRSPAGVAFTRYAEDMSRFISEYGIHASPALTTLERALPATERRLGSEGLIHLIKDEPKNKIDAIMAPLVGSPETLVEYVDLTQITQAEGLKFGIEHFRRRTPHCSGSLIWQLNDCWPCVSWSLIDYNGFGKAGYYYVRRAYAPIMASFKATDAGVLELWIVNDRRAPAAGELTVARASFAGAAEWSEQVAWSVGAGESLRVWTREIGVADPDQVVTVRAHDGAFAPNRHWFAPIKDLRRGEIAAPEVTIESLGERSLAVTLTARTYLHFAHILAPDERTQFSDNYFDLAAGETVTLSVSHPIVALRPEDIEVRWR